MTSARAGLQQDRLVRQLVRTLAANARKMALQEASDLLHAGDGAAAEVTCAIVAFHFAANLFPLTRLDLRRQAAIGQNLDRAVRDEHIDEDAVVMQRVPHPEVREDLQGPGPRREVVPQLRRMQRRLDDE